MSTSDVEFLREARKVRRRQPDEVYERGTRVLQRLGTADESWSVREQVLVAAMDRHDTEGARLMLGELEARFPGSQRVKRLRALFQEYTEDYAGASATYAEMLKENKNNGLVQKRQACVLKAQGKTKEAIQALNRYATVYQADAEVWQELMELYMLTGSYREAAFCCEELILVNAQDYLSHQLYAELQFTLGNNGKDSETLRLARKYFAQSLVLKPEGNARALWGVATTAFALGSMRSTKELKGEASNADLHAHAAARLQQLYATDAPEGMAELVGRVLEKQAALAQ